MNMRTCWNCGGLRGVAEAWCPTCRAPGVRPPVDPDAEAGAESIRFTPASLVALAAALALGFGSFLPWIQATVPAIGRTVSQTGMAGGDGIATLAAGCAVATFAFVMARGVSERWVHVALLGIGAAMAVLAGVEFADISGRFARAHHQAGNQILTEYGLGLWLVTGGAIAAIAAGGLALWEDTRSRPDRSPRSPSRTGMDFRSSRG